LSCLLAILEVLQQNSRQHTGLGEVAIFENIKINYLMQYNSDIQLNVHSEAAILPSPMLSEAFYEDCIKFASRIIRLEKCNLFAEDIVHDLIIEQDINYGNYQKKIRSKIITEKNGFKPLTIETLYYKRKLPFKTNQDFTCTRCKNQYPDSERQRYFSSKGFFVERNCCKSCERKIKLEWEKKAILLKMPYWFRKLERQRKNYNQNKNRLRDKRIARYHATKKLTGRKKTDWAKEKLLLSDKYIIMLLNKKYKKADITEEMILEKRISILHPQPKVKKSKEEIRAAYNKKKMERYYNDAAFRDAYKKKVSEYTKANKEKRRLSKLRLKEAYTGF
jgi:hypothetical protein